jgi:hypothetical protein
MSMSSLAPTIGSAENHLPIDAETGRLIDV